MHRHIFLSSCAKLLHTILQYCCISVHIIATCTVSYIAATTANIVSHHCYTRIVSYRANIVANIANVGSRHCYMHCQLSSQYRGYYSQYIGSHHCYTHSQLPSQYCGDYSQYWFASLLHALSVIEPISQLI